MFGTLVLALPALIVSTFLPRASPRGSEDAAACSGLVPHLPINTTFPSVGTYHVMFFCCVLWMLVASFMDIWACTHCGNCSRRARAHSGVDVFATSASLRGGLLAAFIICMLLVHVHFDAASSVLQLSEWARIQAALDVHTTWVYFPLAAATCDGRLPVAVVNATFMPPALCEATCSILLQHATLCCLPWSPATAPHVAYATHVLRSRASIGLYVLFVLCQFGILVWTIAGCVVRKRRRMTAVAVHAHGHIQHAIVTPEVYPTETANVPLLTPTVPVLNTIAIP